MAQRPLGEIASALAPSATPATVAALSVPLVSMRRIVASSESTLSTMTASPVALGMGAR